MTVHTPVHGAQHHEGHEFLGHFLGHDVWLYRYPGDDSRLGPSIVARYGSDGCEYASSPAGILLDTIAANTRIGGDRLPGGSMPYHNYLASDYVCPSTAAMLQGLALRTLRQLTEDVKL